jgi:hypothetical protein
LAHIERNGDTAEHAEMLRLKGEVLLMRDFHATGQAERCFAQHSKLLARRKVNGGSCVCQLASLACCAILIAVMKHAGCSRRSSTGSLKDLTCLI